MNMSGSGLIGRKPATVIAALAVLTVAIAGCTDSGEEGSESAKQAASFPDIYAQTIEWGECNDDYGMSDPLLAKLSELGEAVDDFTCGMVTVPLDWNDTDSAETIELATLHIPSTGTSEPLGTLFTNPGGPGASGIGLAYSLPSDPAFDEILDNYDMLGFDPRGIGRSSPIECEAVSDIQELNIATCADEEPLAATMGTSQVARDMELLRSLSGDEELNYLGYSYGTVLGATYSTIFPERVGRMVLDSAWGSSWASPIGVFDQLFAAAREAVALVEDCETLYAVAACPLSGEAGLVKMYADLEETPLIASDGSEVDADTMYGYLVTSLYQRAEGRSLVLETFGAALGGDQEKVDDVAAAMQGGGAAVSLDGTIVRCHSFPEDPRLIELVAHIEEVGLPAMMGGPEINDDTLDPYINLSCDALPSSGDDIVDSFSGSPDAPILVIGITGDHATPYEGSQRLTEELGNATLLTLEGYGHGASYGKRSACIDGYTTTYLVEGTSPLVDTVCQDD
ncbi:alpha/beta hydrolase (plasmid) [Coraliomargarita sp. W4R53]